MICPYGPCYFWDGFECSRSPVIKEDDEQMPCDYDYVRENFTAYIRDDVHCGAPLNSLMVEHPITRETPVRSR